MDKLELQNEILRVLENRSAEDCANPEAWHWDEITNTWNCPVFQFTAAGLYTRFKHVAAGEFLGVLKAMSTVGLVTAFGKTFYYQFQGSPPVSLPADGPPKTEVNAHG